MKELNRLYLVFATISCLVTLFFSLLNPSLGALATLLNFYLYVKELEIPRRSKETRSTKEPNLLVAFLAPFLMFTLIVAFYGKYLSNNPLIGPVIVSVILTICHIIVVSMRLPLFKSATKWFIANKLHFSGIIAFIGLVISLLNLFPQNSTPIITGGMLIFTLLLVPLLTKQNSQHKLTPQDNIRDTLNQAHSSSESKTSNTSKQNTQ